MIRAEDTLKGMVSTIEVGLAVFGTGIVPHSDIEQLSQMREIPVAAYGLFMDSYPKLGHSVQ